MIKRYPLSIPFFLTLCSVLLFSGTTLSSDYCSDLFKTSNLLSPGERDLKKPLEILKFRLSDPRVMLHKDELIEFLIMNENYENATLALNRPKKEFSQNDIFRVLTRAMYSTSKNRYAKESLFDILTDPTPQNLISKNNILKSKHSLVLPLISIRVIHAAVDLNNDLVNSILGSCSDISELLAETYEARYLFFLVHDLSAKDTKTRSMERYDRLLDLITEKLKRDDIEILNTTGQSLEMRIKIGNKTIKLNNPEFNEFIGSISVSEILRFFN